MIWELQWRYVVFGFLEVVHRVFAGVQSRLIYGIKGRRYAERSMETTQFKHILLLKLILALFGWEYSN